MPDNLALKPFGKTRLLTEETICYKLSVECSGRMAWNYVWNYDGPAFNCANHISVILYGPWVLLCRSLGATSQTIHLSLLKKINSRSWRCGLQTTASTTCEKGSGKRANRREFNE